MRQIKAYTDEFLENKRNIENAEKTLNRYYEKRDKLESLGTNKESTAWKSNAYDIKNAEAYLDRYIKKKEYLEKSGNDVTRQLSFGRQAINFGGSLLSISKNAALKGWGGMTKVMGGLQSTFSKVTSVINKASGAYGALIQKFKTGLSVINPFNSGLKKTHSTMGSGLKNILKYTIGIRSLFVLFNRLRSAAVDGFKNLAQYSNKTNRSISMLMSSLTQLKNSLAAAFAPVLNTVAPILDAVIQKIISVMNAIGQLTSALTGSGTYIRAKKVNQDYAASLNQNATSANDANEANKELQKTILGFDQINKMDAPNSGASSGNSGTDIGGLSPNDMFETVQIPNKVNNLAKQIKNAWKNADFTDIGALVGRKLNSALEGIQWENINKTCNRIAKSVATFLNGFLETADWYLVGQTISRGINNAFETANAFASSFHWESFGNAVGNGIDGALQSLDWGIIRDTTSNIGIGIAELLNSAISYISWTTLGVALSNGVNIAFAGAKDFIDTFDWTTVGTSVGTGINYALEGINWELIQGTIRSSVSGIIGSINGFIQTADWNLIGQSIAEYWNSKLEIFRTAVTEFDWIGAGAGLSDALLGIIDNINYSGIGQAFSNGLKGILDAGISFLENTDWWALGESVYSNVKEILTNIDWTGIADRTFEVIGGAFGGLASFVSGLFGSAISDAKQYIIDHFTESGEWTWEGFKKGVTDMVTGIGTWIKDHIFTPFIDGFKNAFGIHSPSTVMEEMGGYLMDGLLGGIKGLVDDVVGVFTDIGDRIGETWDNITEWTSEKWENITSTVSGFWDDLKTGASEKFEDIKESVSGTWESVKETAGSTWENISGTVGGFWDWLIGKSEKDFPEIQKNAEDSFNSTEKTSDSSGSGSQKSVRDAIKSMKSDTSTGMQQVFKNVESYMTSIYNIITNKFRWAGDRVNTLLGDMSEDVGKSFRGMDTDVQQAMNQIANSFNTLGYKIQNSLGSLYDVGRNAAQSFSNGFRSVYIPTPHINVMGYNRYQMGNTIVSTPNFGVQWYASGGFPNAGELFMARENGPELIGRMGRKNAVANNNQIVDGIKAGVFEAVMDAFEASDILNQGNSEKNVYIEFTLKADSETVYKIVRKGKKKHDGRYFVTETE